MPSAASSYSAPISALSAIPATPSTPRLPMFHSSAAWKRLAVEGAGWLTRGPLIPPARRGASAISQRHAPHLGRAQDPAVRAVADHQPARGVVGRDLEVVH